MPFYVADYLRDTRHLTAAEHGAYLLLIMQYWTAGCLPKEDSRLARIACMSEQEWLEARSVIEALFQPGWRHKRIDDELAKSAEKYDRRSEAGKRGASAKHNSSNSAANAEQMPPDNSGNATANAEQKPPDNSGNALASSSQPQPPDRIGDAHARGQSQFTEGSKALANALWVALGFDNPLKIPTEFSGVDWRAIEWEKAGWTVDLIEAEARKLARDSPLKPLSYFEKVFATSFARRQAPLPVVSVRESEQLTVTRNGTPQNQSSVVAVARRLAEQFESQSGNGLKSDSDAVLRIPSG